jgi:hypothetical protein
MVRERGRRACWLLQAANAANIERGAVARRPIRRGGTWAGQVGQKERAAGSAAILEESTGEHSTGERETRRSYVLLTCSTFACLARVSRQLSTGSVPQVGAERGEDYGVRFRTGLSRQFFLISSNLLSRLKIFCLQYHSYLNKRKRAVGRCVFPQIPGFQLK